MLRNIILCVTFAVGGLCFGFIYIMEHLESSAPALEEPSPWYLVVMGILFLIGASFIFLPLLERRRLVRAGGDPIKVITVMLRKSRFNALITTLCFGGATYFIFGVGFLDWDPTSDTGVGGYIVFGLLVAVCGLIAAFYAWGFIKLFNIPGSWILKTIRDNPQEIAWVYESVARTQGVKMSGYSTVYIWFADGKNYMVQLGHTGAKEFIAALAARAPHARIGYSEEVQKLYAENPARFRSGG